MVGFTASCDVGAPDANDETRGFNRPAVQVLGVRVTTDYNADERPIRSELTEGGESALPDVPVSASIAIRFDRLLLPHKVLRQSICIRPSTDTVDSIRQCTDPAQPFAQVEYNPVLRTVFYRLAEGSQLDADTRYRITVFATEDQNEQGFFAFDGAPVAKKYIFDFQTAADASTATAERLPGAERYCDAKECFDVCESANTTCRDDCMGQAATCFQACTTTSTACDDACRPLCVEPTCFQRGDLVAGSPAPTIFKACGFTLCHASDGAASPMPDPSTLAIGLNLFTKAGIAATAINVTAHQTQTGEQSLIGDESPVRFGRAMPIIDPGNPGNSYLMYKVIVNPLNHQRTAAGALADPLMGLAEPEFAFEIDRLRDGMVVGLPMPAATTAPAPIFDLTDPSGVLSLQRMLRVNAWIANGAVLDCAAN